MITEYRQDAAAQGLSLSESKLFCGVDRAVIAECAAEFRAFRVPKRRKLYAEGDGCAQLYCLIEGLVRVGRLAEDGTDLTLCLLGRGDVFGEEALFAGSLRYTSAITLGECTLAVGRGDRVRALLLQYPLLALNLARCFREYDDRGHGQFGGVALRRVRERLMTLLQELAVECGSAEPEGTRIDVALTHAELATLLGTARETVTSELAELTRSGQILRRGRKIVIPSAPAAIS